MHTAPSCNRPPDKRPRKADPKTEPAGCILAFGATSSLPFVPHVDPDQGARLDEPSARCRTLWAFVVLRLLDDSFGRGLGIPANRGGMARRIARSFLREPSSDRAELLSLAGIDLEAFVSRGLPRLEEQWRAMDAKRQSTSEQMEVAA